MMTMAQDGVRDATRTCDCPTRANTGWTTSPVRHRRDQIRMAMAGGRYWSLTGTRLGHWLGSLTYLLLRLGKIVHQTRGELVNKLALRISALPQHIAQMGDQTESGPPEVCASCSERLSCSV